MKRAAAFATLKSARFCTGADTETARREDLAAAAMSLSLFVHLDGIGEAWGRPGWLRRLVSRARNAGDHEHESPDRDSKQGSPGDGSSLKLRPEASAR
jgi:hypothetical protein